MLESRATGLLLCAVTLVVAGVVWDLSALAIVGALGLGLLVSELRRLARAVDGHQVWGLALQPEVVRLAADTQHARTHRVDQPMPLHFRLTCSLSHLNTRVTVHRVVTTPGLRVSPRQTALVIEQPEGVTLPCEAVAQTAAVHHVIGVHVVVSDPLGLTSREVFLPCPIEFAALPRSLPLSLRQLPETRRRAPRRALGNHVGRREGMGDELRELRQHRPGDPFKHIAWKASARRGHLVSRVFEQERAQAIYVVLDVGASMRWGPTGQSALDQAIDLTHSLAEQSALASVPFALSLADCDFSVTVPPTVGHAAVKRADQALLDVRRAVHESVAPLADAELVHKVVDYLEAVEGAQLRGVEVAQTPAMTRQRTVMAALARLPERERSPMTRGAEPSVRADLAILRRFCRSRGITLPYRGEASASARVDGILQALSQATRARQGPYLVVLISDFLGFDHNCAPLWRGVARAARHGNRCLLLALRSSAATEADAIDLGVETGAALRRSMEVRRGAELERLRRSAGRVGASFIAEPRPDEMASAWAQAFAYATG